MQLRTRLSKSQSRSFARTRRDRRIWAAGLVLVVLLAWVFVFSRLTWLGAFTIGNVQVYGADPDIAPQLRAAALGQLGGSYLGLFSRSNDLLYPARDIAAAVKAASPRVSEVDVHRAGGRGLAITVTERAPAAFVCAELPDFTTDPAGDPDCYFADASGLVFEQAPTSSPQISARYYEPDLSTPLGSYATSTGLFERLQSLLSQAGAAGIEPLGMLFKDGGEYELYIENPSSTGSGADHAAASSTAGAPDIAVVYMDDAGKLPDELSNLVSFWKKEMSQGRADASMPRFESIDVRYSPNVFYRLEK